MRIRLLSREVKKLSYFREESKENIKSLSVLRKEGKYF